MADGTRGEGRVGELEGEQGCETGAPHASYVLRGRTEGWIPGVAQISPWSAERKQFKVRADAPSSNRHMLSCIFVIPWDQPSKQSLCVYPSYES